MKAFVLSGGGAKGCYQVGVIKALAERGIHPDALYGTSVGALNSAGMSFLGIEGTEKIWKGIRRTSDVFGFNWNFLWSGGLYNSKPLRRLLNENLQGEPKLPATVTKVDLVSGSLLYSKEKDEDFLASVEASTAVPVVSEPVDGRYVDGGVREITPLKQAIDDGAHEIYVILCSPWKKNPNKWEMPKWSALRTFKVLTRTFDIVGHEIFVNDVRVCKSKNNKSGQKTVRLKIWAPEKLVLDTHDFNQEKIAAGLAQGYEDGKLVNGNVSLKGEK